MKKTANLMVSFAFSVLFALPAIAVPRQVLAGHVPKAMAGLGLQSFGRLPVTNRLSLILELPLRNTQDFTNLLTELYRPGPQYHHWLTPDDIARRFGPTEQDYQAVVAFMETNGFQVTGTYPDRTLLRVSGPVAGIEKILHVKLQTYQHPTERRTFYAPDTEPSLDLPVQLRHITGLDNFNIPKPGGGASFSAPGDGGGSGPSQGFWGYDFRNAYIPGVSLTGSGQVVGLLELDGYYFNDITNYEVRAGLPLVPLQNVLVDGFNGTPSTNVNSVGEVSLDIDMAIAMAPGLSKVMVYETQNGGVTAGNPDWLDVLKRIQTDNIAKQISSSWFIFDNASADTIYQEYALQGQSFFQCSGDVLAFYNGVSQWADDPNITICGGTMLTTTNGSWASETTWNNGDGVNGTGGGISASYLGNKTIPLWQQGVSMSFNGGSTSQRNVPDVSMVAHNVFIYYLNNKTGYFWGTSIAAPLWAGFTALVNQQAVSQGKPTVGFLNPALYGLGNGPLYNNYYHDITTGNNTSTNSSALYFATTGFDLCTGWGSPKGVSTVNGLAEFAGLVFVDFNYSGTPQNGQYNTPFHTLAQGVSGVSSGGTIFIERAGTSAETMTISKPMTITSQDAAATVGR